MSIVLMRIDMHMMQFLPFLDADGVVGRGGGLGLGVDDLAEETGRAVAGTCAEGVGGAAA